MLDAMIDAFQFHKGAIRTSSPSVTPFSISDFNSIKVRLERAAALTAGAGLLFQFHKGAIRTQ